MEGELCISIFHSVDRQDHPGVFWVSYIAHSTDVIEKTEILCRSKEECNYIVDERRDQTALQPTYRSGKTQYVEEKEESH